MLTRRRIFSTALPLSGLLLGVVPVAASMPPLQVVRGFVVKAQAIEPTKIGSVPMQAGLLAARAETTDDRAPMGVIDIVPWQRDCAAMGYPADYLGIVVGETQRDNAGGIRRDVWLSNNCMAPSDTTILAAVGQDVELLAARQPDEAATNVDPEPEVMVAAVTERRPPIRRRTRTSRPIEASTEQTAASSVPEQHPPLCGAASGNTHRAMPLADLCAHGQPGAVIGQGPWQWECASDEDFPAAQCFALLAAAVTPAAAEQTEQVPVQTAVLASAAPTLTTPLLPESLMTTTTTFQGEQLSVAALVTPRLETLALNHNPAPGVVDYRPEPPIRAGAALTANMTPLRGFLEEDLTELMLSQDAVEPSDEAFQRLELLGKKLAVNRLARVTVTAYASLTPERDARAARRFSLNRALAVRDALMLGGAGSEQVRLRALGANVPSGAPDRIDIVEN